MIMSEKKSQNTILCYMNKSPETRRDTYAKTELMYFNYILLIGLYNHKYNNSHFILRF